MTAESGSPRIVHLVPCDGLGGVETAARSAAMDEKLSCDLTLFFLAGASLERRARIVDHPERRLNSPSTFAAAVRDVLALRPDVLICSLWRSMLVGLAVKRRRPRTRLVVFLHTSEKTHFLDRLAQGLAIRAADEVWVDSQATLDSISGQNTSRTRLISFVLRRRARLPWAPPAPRFVTWGRLHPHKGHDRSLELIGELVKLGVDARLTIWGPNCGSETALRRQCRSLGLADRVTFAGEVAHDRLAEIAAGNSFYLGLSRLEGFGMSVVEAMQLGLVPVATAVGEIASYVGDGENGILVDPADLPTTARRIAELLQSPEEIQRLAAAASRTWDDSPLYAEDFCRAARALALRVP
jgi:glycosyltransferase involved in cell wall biosynthesis